MHRVPQVILQTSVGFFFFFWRILRIQVDPPRNTSEPEIRCRDDKKFMGSLLLVLSPCMRGCTLGALASSEYFLSPGVKFRAPSVFFPLAFLHISSCCPAVSGIAAAFKQGADWFSITKWRYPPVLGIRKWRAEYIISPINIFAPDLRTFIIESSKEHAVGHQWSYACRRAVQRAACSHTVVVVMGLACLLWLPERLIE